MDTNNREYQEALHELYVAMMKVMRLSGAACLDSNAIQQEITSRMFGMTGATYTAPQVDNTAVIHSQTPPLVTSNTTPPPASSVQAAKTVVETRYAYLPEEEDGQYYFKRTTNENDGQRYFQITIYSDNSCRFEMVPGIMGERLQHIKDSLNMRAIRKQNEPGSNSCIVNIEPGICQKNEGRKLSFTVTQPLTIKFE